MQPIRPEQMLRRALPSLILVGAIFVFAPAEARPETGDVEIVSLRHEATGLSHVPPYIDAQDGIAPRGAPWDPDPANWRKSAAVTVRGAQYGESIATVKLRIEGKGDPIQVQVPQQTCMITDDSGSMAWNDPGNMRVQAMQFYIGLLAGQDEICHGAFAADLPSGQKAEIRQGLTTNYAGAQTTIGTYASNGGTPIGTAFRSANDEIVPRIKRPTHVQAIIHLTDGCGNSDDPPGWPTLAEQEVDRMVVNGIKLFNIGLYPDPNSGDKQACEPRLVAWSLKTGGQYFWVQDPKDLDKVYQAIKNSMTKDIAGWPPKTGEPMVRFKLLDHIEVVPGTFSCTSLVGNLCSVPTPNRPVVVPLGNKGVLLEFDAPIPELKIRQAWEIQFGMRAYTTGMGQPVNSLAQSYIEYVRYDGTPGATDTFEQLYVDVIPDIPGGGPVGIGTPNQPPPPPPHGGIPQLIPQPQQVPLTYIQNLPVLHGVAQVQGMPIQYLLGSALGMGVADRIKTKSRIKQGVKIAMASM